MKNFTPLLLITLVAAFLLPASAQKSRKTIAVLEFENATQERALSSWGVGIAETLTTHLSGLRQFTLIERTRLQDVLKELKFSRSQYADPGSAQRIGKLLGADYVVVGAFQKSADDVRLTARLVEVETAKVAAPAVADGKLIEFFQLQDRLARGLAAEIEGSLRSEPEQPSILPTENLDAFGHFSDGVAFIREDLSTEALDSLNKALALDPNYSLAHFHKGLALQKLGRWEEAVQALKLALRGSTAKPRELWSWEAPFEKPGSRRVVAPIEPVREPKPREGEEKEFKVSNDFERLVFAEKLGQSTALYFVHPQQRTVKRIVLLDPDLVDWIGLGAGGIDNVALLGSVRLNPLGFFETGTIYKMDMDSGSLQWRLAVQGPASGFADLVTPKSIYLHTIAPAGETLLALDLSTGTERWRKKLQLTTFRVLQDVPGIGELLVLRLPGSQGIGVVSGRDGTEHWKLNGDFSLWSLNPLMVLMDREKKTIAGYQLKSGVKEFEVPIPWKEKESADARFVLRVIKDDVVYVAGKDNVIYALSIAGKPGSGDRLLWKTKLGVEPRGLLVREDGLFVAAEDGTVFWLETDTGKVRMERKFGSSYVYPVYLGKGLGILSSGRRLFAADLKTGETKWESPTWKRDTRVVHVNGAVLLQSGKDEITALDAESGKVLWRHLGTKSVTAIPGKNSIFVADLKGVREYSTPQPSEVPDPPTLEKKEVLAQLALSYLHLGKPDEAAGFAGRVLRELDADSPAAHYVMSEVYRLHGDPKNSMRELISYYRLIGSDTGEARSVLQILRDRYNLVWHAQLEQLAFGDPIRAGRLVLFRSADLLALDPLTGRPAWIQPKSILINPLSGSGKEFLLISTPPNPQASISLLRLDSASGEAKPFTAFELPFAWLGSLTQQTERHLLLWLVGPELASGRTPWKLFCLDVQSAKTIWEVRGELRRGEFSFFLRADDDTVVYATADTLVSLSIQNGKEIDRFVPGGSIYSVSSPSAALSGRIYYSIGNSRLAAYDLTSHKVVWDFTLPEGPHTIRLEPQYFINSALYFFNANEVFALNLREAADEERIRWRLAMPEGVQATQIKLRDGLLYCLRDDGVLLKVDAQSGKLLSEHLLPWEVKSFEVIDEILYAVSSDGHAYAMKVGPAARATAQ